MMLTMHDVIDQTYSMLQARHPSTRIVLLHPRSRYRSMVIARLLKDEAASTFYYAMGPDDVNLASFLNGVTDDIATQHPNFGRHLNSLLYDLNPNSEVLLNAFCRDLAELSDASYYFVIDEYDRSDSADDIQKFIERLIDLMPPNCCFIINSRTLPRLPWVSLIARRYALILEDAQLVQRDFYSLRRDGARTLHVFGLGPGIIMINGQQIESWEGHLPRLLFFFALDKPVVTRSEICHAFWPDLEDDQAVNVFHVTKRRLHKALKVDVLVHIDGYYRINPKLDVIYDVMEFTSMLVEGRTSRSGSSIAPFHRATELYRGPFLQSHNEPWILTRRSDFRAGQMEALTHMADFRDQQGRPEQALNLYLRALAEDNTSDDLHRRVILLYATLGRRSEAATHFQALRETRHKNGHTIPPEIQSLYNDIML